MKPTWTDFLDRRAVFVFGSNLASRHGLGAALFAAQFRGAQRGCAVGVTGQSYAIPTKDGDLRTLPLEAISVYVEQFIEYAAQHPKTYFQLTKVGCGLAGHQEDAMRRLFASAPANVLQPGTWDRSQRPRRVIIAGSRGISAQQRVLATIDVHLSGRRGEVEVVSGMAKKGPDSHAVVWAHENHVCLRQFPAHWEHYPKKRAGMIRNSQMAWYADELIAFLRRQSNGTRDMIRNAEEQGLKTTVVHCDGPEWAPDEHLAPQLDIP